MASTAKTVDYNNGGSNPALTLSYTAEKTGIYAFTASTQQGGYMNSYTLTCSKDNVQQYIHQNSNQSIGFVSISKGETVTITWTIKSAASYHVLNLQLFHVA